MKHAVSHALIGALLLQGCGSMQPLNCDETCAISGMVCRGQTVGSSYNSEIGYAGNDMVSMSGSSSGLAFSCEVPQASDERAQDRIEAYRRDAESKSAHNHDVKNRQTWGLVLGCIGGLIGGVFLAKSLNPYASPSN